MAFLRRPRKNAGEALPRHAWKPRSRQHRGRAPAHHLHIRV